MGVRAPLTITDVLTGIPVSDGPGVALPFELRLAD
jgi:hypothetical protein